jgi:uracil-DNA glycosylase family 4
MAAGDGNQKAMAETQIQVRAYLEYFRDLGIYDFYRDANHRPLAELIPRVAVADVAPRETLQPATNVIAAPPEVDAPAGLVATEPEIARPISLNNRLPLPAERVAEGDKAQALALTQADIGDCTRCPLAYAGRRNIVFGDGNAGARLMFVGEGPGADEDAQGLPFVGKSGQLLNNMIGAMGLSREQVYIANIVKCRPPANRAPEAVEANTCTQFLARQMDIVQPEFVVALGATAAAYLLGVKQSLASLRGQWHEVRGARAIVTYHPAFLLRDPRQKGEAWKDLQMVMAAMGLKGRG